VSEHHIAVLCKGFGQIGGYGIVWLDQFRELVPQFRATSRICHTLPTNHHVIYIYTYLLLIKYPCSMYLTPNCLG
jgi:hypothetical protein